jgi:hypothetical protein
MSTAITQRLRSFAVDLLEQQGALLEWPEHEESGLVILPRSTAALLECPDSVAITAVPTQAGLVVNLTSPFLERAEKLFPPEASELSLKIDTLYLKKSAMDEPVARAFAFPNARVKVLGALADRVEYHYWHFAAMIESDERWEDVVTVVLNSRSRVPLDLPDPLNNSDACTAVLDDIVPDVASAGRAAGGIITKKSGPFVQRLEERMVRDLKRLKDYYHALLDDASPTRSRRVVDANEQESRKQAVKLELDRKIAELRERYMLRPSLRLVALVRLDMPALAVKLNVQRRDGEKQITVFWNALTKTLEPLACDHCGAATFSVHFAADITTRCAACAQRDE